MKKFKMIKEKFICEYYRKKVSKLNYTARDHCPYCLYSKHVDIMHGDRKNECCGLLVPISVEKYKNTYKIVYKCNNCKQIHKNIIANDDNFDEILKIMQKPSKY